MHLIVIIILTTSTTSILIYNIYKHNIAISYLFLNKYI